MASIYSTAPAHPMRLGTIYDAMDKPDWKLPEIMSSIREVRRRLAPAAAAGTIVRPHAVIWV